MSTSWKRPLRALPGVRSLLAQRDAASAEADLLRGELAQLRASLEFVPPGHFYSVIPSMDEVHRDQARLFGPPPRHLPGIELDDDAQLALLESFVGFYEQLPFAPDPRPGLRYHYENPAYSYSDAILLYCMIRHLEPERIVEVGSGYSSCLLLDTNDLHFDGRIDLTFVEPYPDLLRSLLAEDDEATIVGERLQDVDLGLFEQLRAGDVLLIDSTHVGKIGSDVNRILFEILPALAPGVHVHVHDVMYPFEYPRVWIEEGRAWNEAYLLRAFLQYNSAFEIVLMNTYLQRFHREFVAATLPLCLRNPGGSIWLRRREPA